jgi:hypothetical protein
MNLTEAFEVLIKGRKMDVGTISTRANGVQYQKQGDGKWVEYKKPKAQVAEKEPVATKQNSYEEDYKDVNLGVFDGIDKKDAYKYMAVAGVPKGFSERVELSKGIYDNVVVHIDTKDISMVRSIKGKTIKNASFYIRNKAKYNGAYILYNQAKNAQKEGFEEIETTASGNYKSIEHTNGYYTWLRLGYKPDDDRDKEFVEEANAKLGTNITSVTELMHSQEGRDWWKENGGGFGGTFDLSKNSYSMKTLEEYVKNKNK